MGIGKRYPFDEDRAARRALKEAVARAYFMFSGFKPGEQLSVCRCGQCMEPEIEPALLTTPLRQIEPSLLSEYNWAADAPGSIPFDHDELRYFLPRFFELIAEEQYPHFSDPALTLRRLGYANYRTNWPKEQATAIDRFFNAFLELQLSRPIGITQTQDGRGFPFTGLHDDILCLCVHGGADLTALLARWETKPNLAANRHRATMAYALARSEQLGFSFPGPFWDALPNAAATLRSWVLMPKTLDCLKQALHTESDPDLREAWQTTHDDISTRPHRA